MADRANGDKKKGRAGCLVNKTDMARATNYAHALGLKVTGFEFSYGKIGMTVEDRTGAKGTITQDDLDRAIEADIGED
jgi:hypothetical protein